MKKQILLLAICLIPFFSKAQYTPLNLDTSCFWIQQYHDYHGSQPQINIYGEVLQYVEKDTTIMGQVYHKVRGYPTANMVGTTNDIGALWSYQYYNPRIFIREDTVAKKIFGISNFSPFTEVVLLNFDVQIGDTITYAPASALNYIGAQVDSINMATYFGINRRTIFADFANTFNADYKRIEGVGATLNFPAAGIAEWDIAVYTLQAFVKNNTVLYKDSVYPIDSIYRKPAYRFAPVAVQNVSAVRFSSMFSNNNLVIQNPKNEELKINVLNLQGQPIFTLKSKENNIQHRIENVAAGIYILSVRSEKGVENKKIFVR